MEQKDLIDLIEELIKLPKEIEWVEFKKNNNNPEQIGQYISALSNSACLENQKYGYLIFGIEDKSHIIIGTSFKPKKEKIGNEELENWLATQLSPKIDFKIFEFNYNNKHLAIFKIDATRNTPVKFKDIAYIRIGSYKKKLKDHPEKERKIWNKIKEYIFEEEVALNNLTTDEILKLLDYSTAFDLLNITLPYNKNAIIKKLEEENLIKSEFGKYYITNLGAILFAKNLNEFKSLKNKIPRVIVYKNVDRLNTIKEHQIEKGYAVGFEILVDYINDNLPVNEEIGKVYRKNKRVYPEVAIRELVANTLIHQDFSIKGMSVMIEIFKNRIEITNPGNPLINTDRFIDYAPQSRNKILASIMRRMNFCEERGSGIDKVIKEVELFQLPAPDFISENKYTRVILYSPKTLRQMTKTDKIRACYQHCCLKFISGEYMSNQTLRERFKIKKQNYSMVSRIIRDSIEAGLIKEYDNSRIYIPYWAN